MNMKRKPLCAILLWLLVIVFPMILSLIHISEPTRP